VDEGKLLFYNESLRRPRLTREFFAAKVLELRSIPWSNRAAWRHQPITNMKTTTKISLKPLVLLAAAFGFALTAAAQGMAPSSSGRTVTPASGSAYGLLGQNYMGVSFAYTDLDKGPAGVARTWGFVANRPTEAANVDASFKYNYTGMNALGIEAHTSEFAIGATGYIPLSVARPFVEANLGWGFINAGSGNTTDSFSFLIGTGVEIQLAPRFVLTPYASYHEFTRLTSNSGTWNYGVKATFRIAQQYSASVAVDLDDDENLSYRFGLNRHF
jgi:hypothetical protein